MTTQQAKQILLTYRPWTNDTQNPEVTEALALCQRDGELAKWLAAHCAVQNAIQARFQSVPVPDGLRQQIISEHKAQTQAVWWRRPAVLATAAMVALCIAISSLWHSVSQPPGEDVSFAAYRSRMVRTAVKAYGMDLMTNDVAQIQAYLVQHRAPADYVLPKNLDPAASVGCGVLSWQGKPVTMVCFRTGRPLAPGMQSDVFLFVIDQQNVAGPLVPSTPTFATVSRLATASWTEGGKVYVLAAPEKSDLPQGM